MMWDVARPFRSACVVTESSQRYVNVAYMYKYKTPTFYNIYIHKL